MTKEEMIALITPATNLLRAHARGHERQAFGLADEKSKATAIGIARGIAMAAAALDEMAAGDQPRSLKVYVDPLEAL